MTLEIDMAADWATQFYTTIHWIRCREGYKKFRRGLCEECLKQGIITPGTEVHHKIPLTIDNVRDPSISLSWDNLELLCSDCHHAIHEELRESGQKMHRRFKVDADGKVILREDADRLRK